MSVSNWKIYISKDVLFNELEFPYFDLFPSSSSSVQNLDSYYSLDPNMSPPSVVPTPQPSQLSSSHSPSAPSIPPGFSPVSSQPSSKSTSVHPRSSNARSHSESVPAPSSIPVNTHPMQTKSQVLFFSKASYSSCIAANQSEFSRACLTVLGSE